jgi:hypothetical protein
MGPCRRRRTTCTGCGRTTRSGDSGYSNGLAATTAAAGTTSLPGLFATFYDNDNFTGTTATRVVPNVLFDWGSGAPDAMIGGDTFSARIRRTDHAHVDRLALLHAVVVGRRGPGCG